MADLEIEDIISIIEKSIKAKCGSNNSKGCDYWIFPNHFRDFVINCNFSGGMHENGYKAEILELKDEK